MLTKNWKTDLSWIILTESVGLVAGFLTRNAVTSFQASVVQPPLYPPGILFPIVWALLYGLMGLGASRIYLAPESSDRTKSIRLFLVQLGVNFLWPFLFFEVQAFGLALVWLLILWGLILWMIRSFYRVEQKAALLQIPYLLWVSFAAYLNLGVWLLNP